MITQLKIKLDKNGNKVLLITRNGKSFSIQTNGNLPITHSIGISRLTIGEVIDYISLYGTKRQKSLMEV